MNILLIVAIPVTIVLVPSIALWALWCSLNFIEKGGIEDDNTRLN